MPLHRSLARALAGGALCAACAAPGTNSPAPPVVPVPPAAVDACVVGDGGRDTLVVVLEAAVSGNLAPVPANVAERFAFRQRYETLVRLDCDGGLRPGLAEHWSSDSTGTVWTFELGERRFSGGEPVTAERVAESWTRHGLDRRRGVIDSVVAQGPRTLVVTLGSPAPAGPALLADPALAVAGPRGADGWPEGTRIGVPVLELRTAEGADLRDLLAEGADLAVTRDPDAIAYAERLPEFRVVPLPWDRSYWLLATAPPVGAADGDSAAQARLRTELARDVVGVDARPADPARRIRPCLTRVPTQVAPVRRIAYREGDRTARELAERMVALAGPGYTVDSKVGTMLERSLLNDPAASYVLAVPLIQPSSCADLVLPDHYTIHPLVDTRAHLILRRGAARVAVDADGTPRIFPPAAQ